MRFLLVSGSPLVIPANAGIQLFVLEQVLDPGVRRDDEKTR